MTQILRRSPVSFNRRPLQSIHKEGWEIVLEYEGVGEGPFLVDLSHRSKWDVQDSDLSGVQPWGISIPTQPGECVYQNGILISRMNRTQATCWHLLGESLRAPEGAMYTDVTDASLLLAFMGSDLFVIMEKICSIDFCHPQKRLPCLFQAPVCHVASQVVLLEDRDSFQVALFSCARGYAHTMVEGILDAGAECGLDPTGELVFTNWLTVSRP